MVRLILFLTKVILKLEFKELERMPGGIDAIATAMLSKGLNIA